MKKVIKYIGMLMGALIVGGVMGWLFEVAGVATYISNAITMGVCAAVYLFIANRK